MIENIRGRKGHVNKNNIDHYIDANYLVDDLLCITIHVGKVVGKNEISLRERAKTFTNEQFVKKDLLDTITRILDYNDNPNKALDTDFSDQVITGKTNKDKFYVDDYVEYNREADEFVMVTLNKVLNKSDNFEIYWHNHYDLEAYFDFNAELDVRMNILKYATRICENLGRDEMYEKADEIDYKSDRSGIYDIVPVDYIVLKPIKTIDVQSKTPGICESFKSGFLNQLDKYYPERKRDLQSLFYTFHSETMMDFILNYDFNPLSNAKHNFDDPFKNIEKIKNFAIYAQEKQQQEIYNQFAEIVSNPRKLRGFMDLYCTDNKLKWKNVIDVMNKNYKLNINKTTFALEKYNEVIFKGGEKNEKEILLR